MSLTDRYLRALDATIGAEPAAEEPQSASEVVGYAAAAEEEVSRGDSRMDDDDTVLLASEVEGASDEQWTEFVRRMISARLTAVSASNALGMFEMMPRRLADFGYVTQLQRAQPKRDNGKKRTIWVGKFVAPLTSKAFLRSPRAQYQVFCQSMRDYVRRIESGEIEPCDDLTLSGALAVLHRIGPHGCARWSAGDRFTDTIAFVERVDEVF